FDLGGNSLLLITAQNAVNTAFGTDLTVVDLFAHPTVRDLARHLSTRTGPTPGTEPSPGPAPAGAPPEPTGQGAAGPARRSAESAPNGMDRAKEQAQRQRAARARRTARHERGPRHA
ncbi:MULTISPECIES: acyl carrier protein, partial [unclassified Streptomyces]